MESMTVGNLKRILAQVDDDAIIKVAIPGLMGIAAETSLIPIFPLSTLEGIHYEFYLVTNPEFVDLDEKILNQLDEKGWRTQRWET